MADTWYWTDDGIKAGLDNMLQFTGGTIGGATLRLFQNNPSPAPSKASVLGDLTQCTFAGYAGVGLSSANWPAASVASHVASSVHSTSVTFTRSTSGTVQNCYGAYLTDLGNTKLYGVCLFAGGPFPVTNAGDFVVCKPTLTFESKN